MPQWIGRLTIWVLIIAAMFAGRFGLLLIASDEGELGFWLGVVVLIGATAWLCAGFRRRLVLLAAIVGAILGWIYFQIEWAFDRIVLVDVLQRFTADSIRWLATGLTLVQWPIIAICSVAGAIAAWISQRNSEG